MSPYCLHPCTTYNIDVSILFSFSYNSSGRVLKVVCPYFASAQVFEWFIQWNNTSAQSSSGIQLQLQLATASCTPKGRGWKHKCEYIVEHRYRDISNQLMQFCRYCTVVSPLLQVARVLLKW